MNPSTGVIDEGFQISVDRLKQITINLNSLRRECTRTRFLVDNNVIHDCLNSVDEKISGIQDDLNELGKTLRNPFNTEGVPPPDNITMTYKEFVLLQEVFLVHTKQVLENGATDEPEI